ncbi:MAG: hypothetical protein CMH36_01450 [Microbacterium sp.]|uniref:hypothetical protein n=1 Tax=Microbacterium sp. 4NA327F11 TaxID=2502229 RepID=UPI000C9051D1|nr:hypothetical protein [Microbacterium sp. 4NA327F11]MAL05492.1 hypothetical protein [Microbacterium sp.]
MTTQHAKSGVHADVAAGVLGWGTQATAANPGKGTTVGITEATSQLDARATLREIRARPDGWSTPSATALLREAREHLRPIAVSLKVDPDLALSYAFEAWASISELVLASPDLNLWAWTKQAVRRQLWREASAERKLTSAAGVRRTGADIAVQVDRVDISVDALERVMPTAGIDGLPYETDETPVAPEAVHPALGVAAQFMIIAGLSVGQRERFLSSLADQVERSGGDPRRAAAALTRNPDPAFPGSDEQWRALVSVILGTSRGKPGVLELTAQGHPAPARAEHIAAAIGRLFSPLGRTA